MMQSNQGTPDSGGGCGARLRLGREAAGLTQEEVSARLKMPVRVIRVLESDDWSPLGAPVFVRGQLRSYARLLGLDVERHRVRGALQREVTGGAGRHRHRPVEAVVLGARDKAQRVGDQHLPAKAIVTVLRHQVELIEIALGKRR